jgi:hypothetical protein
LNSRESQNLVLEFSRFEFKYVLHKALREEVESELGYFMHLDPFVETSENNRYFVRSLYFDDPFNTAFYDKIDGLKHRSKFRVRTYSREPQFDTPIFLEEKGRLDNRVFKHRTLIAESSADFDADNLAATLLTEEFDNQVLLEKFRFDWFRKQIRPVALIDYLRRPYLSKYDHEFRVTFDEVLHGYRTDRLFPGRTVAGRQLMPGYTVMEVKFSRQVPAWFHRIIQSYELRRVPLSKICEGMKRLKIAVDL